MFKLPKIIVIVGPTASGKTAVALDLANKFSAQGGPALGWDGAEIVNADSRQIYKGMDIGTAKPDGRWSIDNGRSTYVVEKIPHYLMDIIEPNQNFSLADYKEKAFEAIDDILRRGKLPIVVGGTGLYVRAIVDNLNIPKVAPDSALRHELEKEGLPKLTAKLRVLDPEAAERIDLKNPRRVIRALEVALLSGRSFVRQQTKSAPRYEALQFGINVEKSQLNDRINARVDGQIISGLVDEVARLSKKYSWDLPAMSGIGYKQIGYYLRKEMNLPEAVELIKRDTRRYAKRQMTWFKRDGRIHWVREAGEAEELVRKFLISNV